MKVRDLISAIEEFAPLENQESWDNSGLCIGSEDNEVTSAIIGLDCSEALVDEAVSSGADMIITHHPLIFSGIRKISCDDPVGAAIVKAVRAGINVYAAHTSADKVIGGVSGAMALKLGLSDVEVLDGHDGTGLGAIGNFPVPMEAMAAAELVKKKFGLPCLRMSAPIQKPISRVAMCGGAGSSLIGLAMEKGAQLYLCGDISYHHFFTGKDFMLMDVGHFESEIDIVDILFSLIKKKFPTFAVRIADNINNSNPIYYF